jgi:hypothetical protein
MNPTIPRYFRPSKTHFILLSILSAGGYLIYWQYRNWDAIKVFDQKSDDVAPLWRAIFSILFIYPLFRRMAKDLQSETSTTYKNATVFGVGVIFIRVVGSFVNVFFRHFLERSAEFGVVEILVRLGFFLISVIIFSAFVDLLWKNNSTPTSQKMARGETITIVIFVIFVTLPAMFSFFMASVKLYTKHYYPDYYFQEHRDYR